MNRRQIATKLIIDEFQQIQPRSNIDNCVLIQQLFFLLQNLIGGIGYRFIWSHSLKSPFSFDLLEDTLLYESMEIDDTWVINESDKATIKRVLEMIFQNVNPEKYAHAISTVFFIIKTGQGCSKEPQNIRFLLNRTGYSITDEEITRSIVDLQNLYLLIKD